MKRVARVLLATGVVATYLGVLTGTALAAPFTNGGFESPDITPNAFLVTTPTGWTLAGAPGGNVAIVKSPTFTVTEGTQALDLSGVYASPGPASTGGVQQAIDTVAGSQYTVTYDWTSKCAGSNVRALVDTAPVDTATNAGPTYPVYSTRVFNFTAQSASTTLRFDTTTPGAVGTGVCGTIIDNVTFSAPSTPTAVASPASQCSGPTGIRAQFRKVSFTVSQANQDSVYDRPSTDPAVLAQATDNGRAYINYSDVPSPNPFPSRPAFDVGVPPLTLVNGPGTFAPGANDLNYVMRATGYMNIPTAGLWTFGSSSDDGHRILVGANGALVTEAPIAVSEGFVNIPAPGCYHFAFQWYQVDAAAFIAFADFYARGPGQPTDQLVGDTPAVGGGSTIAVYQGTDSPLTCKITAVRRAPSSFNGSTDEMDVSISDLDGLGGLYNIQATNATIGSVPPNFLRGIPGPVIVRATKIVNTSPSAWSFTISDFNGNTKVCT
jgi:hypothetical protein